MGIFAYNNAISPVRYQQVALGTGEEPLKSEQLPNLQSAFRSAGFLIV